MVRKADHRALLRRAHKDGTYERLLGEQGGVCAICGDPPPEDRRLDIDHDHRTMEIRGLLCRGCNMRLRKDHKPSWLRGAAEYLEALTNRKEGHDNQKEAPRADPGCTCAQGNA